jgi:hypothetical protein
MEPISCSSTKAPSTKLELLSGLSRAATDSTEVARCSSALEPNASGSSSSASKRRCQKASASCLSRTRICTSIWGQFSPAALSLLIAVLANAQSPTPPDAVEQKKVLADATEHALSHDENLPNFICTQTTRRFEDFNGNSGWRPIDIIVERLTYFDRRENYKVIELNGRPAGIAHEQLRGASSSGEFGSVMKGIFLPETAAEFTWQNWFTLRGRRTHVYAYRVLASRSGYHIEVPEQKLNLVTGYHGLIFIDSQRHLVQRITLHADAIPASFPIQDVSLALDYEYTRIGDADYLLPLQFELRSREGKRLVKNDVDYDNYRKFTADSSIQFGPPDTVKK